MPTADPTLNHIRVLVHRLRGCPFRVGALWATLSTGFAILTILGGCKGSPRAASTIPAALTMNPSPDGWVLSSGVPPPSDRCPYLGNGYVGFRTGPAGVGVTGPKGGYVAGLYV